MSEVNLPANEMIICEGCRQATPSDQIFDFAGSPLCPPCRQKYTGGDERYEQQVAEDVAKRDAKYERWKASVKKPLRVSVKDPDMDGASRIIVRNGVLAITVTFLLIGYFAYAVGPDALLNAIKSFGLKDGGAAAVIGAFVGAVYMAIAKTTISVNDHHLEVKTWPFSFKIKNCRVPIEGVRDVELERHTRRSSSDESRSTFYRLNLIMESGEESLLVSGHTKKANYFIQKTLKAMLAARSERFPEEWKV